MRTEGVGPSRTRHRVLRPACLPVPPRPHLMFQLVDLGRFELPTFSVQTSCSAIWSYRPRVVLGWHYTNAPESAKGQVTTVLAGDLMTLPAANAALRRGDGDR